MVHYALMTSHGASVAPLHLPENHSPRCYLSSNCCWWGSEGKLKIKQIIVIIKKFGNTSGWLLSSSWPYIILTWVINLSRLIFCWIWSNPNFHTPTTKIMRDHIITWSRVGLTSVPLSPATEYLQRELLCLEGSQCTWYGKRVTWCTLIRITKFFWI